jgi:hypothetical protein
MIRAWHTELGAAAVLSIAVPVVATGTDGEHVSRSLRVAAVMRPFLLPSLWAHLDEASQAEDPAERLAAGRVVTELLPEWTDGTIHFAWTCAFDVPRDRPERDAVGDLLLAIDWLREAADERLAARVPEDAAELLLAAATIVQHRVATDREVARRLRAELDRDPATIAHELVAAAVDAASNEATRSRLAFATIRLIAGSIRMGDLSRAEEQCRVARRELQEFAGRADADLAIAGLDRLGPLSAYLDEPLALERLRADPLLSEVAEALSALRR